MFSCWHRALGKTLLLAWWWSSWCWDSVTSSQALPCARRHQVGSSITWPFLTAEFWSLGHNPHSLRVSGLWGSAGRGAIFSLS